MNLLRAIQPELILVVAACALFIVGAIDRRGARLAAPVVALVALLVVFFMQIMRDSSAGALADPANAVRVYEFANYIKLIAAGVGAMLVLLAWPTNRDATGNSATDYGTETGEFFALMLLSISGVFLVAGANDLILLFLGIELASIPTYIMVSVSRPLPVAQEAGVKYFFLGAMSAAVMLFGFSYLYGTTGTTDMSAIGEQLRATIPGGPAAAVSGHAQAQLSSWQTLAVVMLIAGFAFKIAAVPLHFYAGDVYQGAATPVTAFLSFVPKTSGMVALIKLLFMVGGGSGGAWGATPSQIAKLLWVLAVLTMTVGNVLGLLQLNVKRVLAYSSIAHSGYMLVGLATIAWASAQGQMAILDDAIQGVLFYLAAYGVMNVAAFGVLMMLPSRDPARRPATSAETFEDLAGTGRRHPALGLAMAVACFSLIGIPLTVGFFGKFYLIRPALDGHNYWLVVLTMVNAAISAAYYLRIVAAMFLRPEPEARTYSTGPVIVTPSTSPSGPAEAGAPLLAPIRSFPVTLAICLSVAAVLLFGAIPAATEMLGTRVSGASTLDAPTSPPSAGAGAVDDRTETLTAAARDSARPGR